jgi:glycosyltransferase involved in cell wall biosynthesis
LESKKIKIFLGAYINSTNAQNLNCRALANHLDKSKFEVFSLSVFSGNLNQLNIKGLKVFKCFRPLRVSKYFGHLWGLWHCDIAYLPKREIMGWNRFLLNLLRKKSFSTVEGILDEKNMESAMATRGNYTGVIKSFKGFDRLFSITKFLGKYNYENHGIISEEKPLYLGTNTEPFLNEGKTISKLEHIIYIGRLFERKGVYDVLSIAAKFPQLQFHIVGDGDQKEAILRKIEDKQLKNITIYGILDHANLGDLLTTMDLHILPSRSEGFPKVTLETAAAGVPSLVYSDYGAQEWITHHHNGFVVDTPEQMIETIQQLKESPELLQLNSKNAMALAKQFDWRMVIKEWEEEIIKLHQS